MSTFLSVTISLIYTAAFIACLWWANSALRQLDIPRRFNLPASVRLLVVLAVGALVLLGFVGWLYTRGVLER